MVSPFGPCVLKLLHSLPRDHVSWLHCLFLRDDIFELFDVQDLAAKLFLAALSWRLAQDTSFSSIEINKSPQQSI